MGNNPSYFKGAKLPVEHVSWNDAVQFCQKLSQKTGKNYRLPSEAEWEYACRAGTTTPFYFGETITPDLVNYNGNYPYSAASKGLDRAKTTDVGSFPPNAFGLYDMHGNVWEWCSIPIILTTMAHQQTELLGKQVQMIAGCSVEVRGAAGRSIAVLPTASSLLCGLLGGSGGFRVAVALASSSS